MMHNFGLGFGYLIGPILSLLFMLAWLVLEIVAVVSLSKVKLSSTARAIWALVILVIPLMGAIAYFIVRPHDSDEV